LNRWAIAAGTGARLALISLSQRAEARRIAALDGYIELAAVPNFNRRLPRLRIFK